MTGSSGTRGLSLQGRDCTPLLLPLEVHLGGKWETLAPSSAKLAMPEGGVGLGRVSAHLDARHPQNPERLVQAHRNGGLISFPVPSHFRFHPPHFISASPVTFPASSLFNIACTCSPDPGGPERQMHGEEIVAVKANQVF